MPQAIFIDTHSHLYLEHFTDDRAAVIQRAVNSGVKYILLPNIDRSSYLSMMDLTHDFPEVCFPMIGVHPTSIKENFREELAFAYEQLKQSSFIAVGEIGIDLYWDKTWIQEQKEAFSIQIDWAEEMELPFIIHCRESFPEVFEVLESKKRSFEGVFHAFSGSLTDAQKAINLGFKLGIGGAITYKNSGLDQVIKEIGLAHLVLETDAPYLTPVPFRGKRNESSFIQYTAGKIASIFGVEIEEVANVTTQNARSVFSQLIR
jgi:TatD DNase family protein